MNKRNLSVSFFNNKLKLYSQKTTNNVSKSSEDFTTYHTVQGRTAVSFFFFFRKQCVVDEWEGKVKTLSDKGVVVGWGWGGGGVSGQ